MVSTVIVIGVQLGQFPRDHDAKKLGKVVMVKLDALLLIVATEPVIWLGSSSMVSAVKATEWGAHRLMADLLTDPATISTETCCPTRHSKTLDLKES